MKAPTVVVTETNGEGTQRTKSTKRDLGSVRFITERHSSRELVTEARKDYGPYRLDLNSEIVTTYSKEAAKATNFQTVISHCCCPSLCRHTYISSKIWQKEQ